MTRIKMVVKNQTKMKNDHLADSTDIYTRHTVNTKM